MSNPSRTEKIISVQFEKYRVAREEIPDRLQWLKEQGFYLFKTSNPYTAYGLVVGPEDSLYQGCLLIVKITFPKDFPFSPPKIENLLSFPKQFNTNLWSSDVRQQLITKDNDYAPFFGLICMDILNTPHSKITFNRYGEQVEVYDKSLEQYSPVLSLNTILIALRSNILNGETRCSYVTDTILRYLTLVYLGIKTEEYLTMGKGKSELAQLTDLDGRTMLDVVREVRQHYQVFNKTVAHDLLQKSEEIEKELGEFNQETLQALTT